MDRGRGFGRHSRRLLLTNDPRRRLAVKGKGLQNELIKRQAQRAAAGGEMARRERPGGLLRFY